MGEAVGRALSRMTLGSCGKVIDDVQRKVNVKLSSCDFTNRMDRSTRSDAVHFKIYKFCSCTSKEPVAGCGQHNMTSWILQLEASYAYRTLLQRELLEGGPSLREFNPDTMRL